LKKKRDTGERLKKKRVSGERLKKKRDRLIDKRSLVKD
jgi:hypothetical protein